MRLHKKDFFGKIPSAIENYIPKKFILNRFLLLPDEIAVENCSGENSAKIVCFHHNKRDTIAF